MVQELGQGWELQRGQEQALEWELEQEQEHSGYHQSSDHCCCLGLHCQTDHHRHPQYYQQMLQY